MVSNGALLYLVTLSYLRHIDIPRLQSLTAGPGAGHHSSNSCFSHHTHDPEITDKCAGSSSCLQLLTHNWSPLYLQVAA